MDFETIIIIVMIGLIVFSLLAGDGGEGPGGTHIIH